jgi:hypothetical protein
MPRRWRREAQKKQANKFCENQWDQREKKYVPQKAQMNAE